jgi:hypothetical protein
MADASSISYIMPVLAFILVFIVTFALLAKTKILGSNSFFHMLISFIVAIIFVIAPTMQKFAMISTPWIAVLIVMISIILMLLTFVRGNVDDLVKSPAAAVVIILVILIVFVLSAVNVFGPVISPYLPGGSQANLTSQEAASAHFFTNPAVIGAVILLIIAAIATWILTKS